MKKTRANKKMDKTVEAAWCQPISALPISAQ